MTTPLEPNQRRNDCKNPSLKGTAAGWWNGTRIAVTDLPSPDGVSRGYAYERPADDLQSLGMPEVDCLPGEARNHSLWLKASSAGQVAALSMQSYVGGTFISGHGSGVEFPLTAGQWVRIDRTQVTASLAAGDSADATRMRTVVRIRGGGTVQVSLCLFEGAESRSVTGETPGAFFDGDSPAGTWTGTNGDSVSVLAVEVGSPPTVSAGADQTVTVGQTWTRYGSVLDDGGAEVTAHQWEVLSGPSSVGAVVAGQGIQLNPREGTYVFRYTATNAAGSGSDEVTLTARAPVTATVGKTSAGSSSSASSANKMGISRASPAESGTAQTGHARLWMSTSSGSTTVRFVLYRDDDGDPGALLGISDTITVSGSAEAEWEFPFSTEVAVTAGEPVWLGVQWADPGSPSINFGRDSTSGGRLEASPAWSTTPDPFTGGTAQSGPIDAWLVYEVEQAAPVEETKTGGDRGAGSETGSTTARITGGDQGVGAETGAVGVSGGDSGSGSEAGFVGEGRSGGDAGSGSESGESSATVTSGDRGVGGEAGGTVATLDGLAGDGGTGLDAGHIVLPGRDHGVGGDELVPPMQATVTSGDQGLGREGGYVESRYGDLVISLWAIEPETQVLFALPDYQRLSLSRERTGRGSISLAYPAAGLNFDLLRACVSDGRDLEVEIWTSGTPVGALRGWLQEASGDDTAETSVWSFAGGFCELRLDEAVVWPQDPGELVPDDDDDPANDEHANEKRELVFAAATPGEIAAFLMAQAHGRGALDDLTWDFTAEHDSDGSPWPKVISTKWSPGTKYSAVLNKLDSLGLAEWAVEWTGTAKVLKLWVPEGRGTDRTLGPRPVILRHGRTLTDAPRKWSARDAVTTLLAIGGEGVYDDVTDSDAQARRGRRIESASSANQLTEESAVAAWAQAELRNMSTGTLEISHGIAMLSGEPRPIIAFDVADWVYSQVGTTLDRYRVVQWTLTVDQKRKLDGTVVLNDRVRDAVIRLQESLAALTAGDTVIGTSEASSQQDTGVPAAPEGVVIGSTAYLVEGESHSSVQVSWLPVDSNTDGTAASDVQGYRVQMAYAAAPDAWQDVAEGGTSSTTASFDATPGTEVRCRVQCFDRNGNTSAWSEVVTHLTESDTTPPGVPSAPEVSEWLGTLRIRWDGLDADGVPMQQAHPDLDVVRVHVSPGSEFTPSADTQVGELRAYGTISVTDLPYDVTQFVRLVAVDRTGNASAPSEQGAATPAQLVQLDIGPDAIGRAQIIDGEIVTAKIADLAVNNAKIADLSVGKLVSGSVTADMLMSTGEIRSGDDPNNYSVIDTAGIRLVFDGQTRVSFDRTTGDALITGTYRSGLSGERIELRPDGTFNMFGASGSDSAQIANDGGVVRFRSRADSSGRRSFVDFNPSGFTASYGTTSTVRSNFSTGETYGVLTAPVVGIRVDTRFDPTDDTANRFFLTYSKNGQPSGDIAGTTMHFNKTPSNHPAWAANDTSIIFVGGTEDAKLAVKKQGADSYTDWLNVHARGFVVESSKNVKSNIGDIREVLDPVATVRRAKAKKFVHEHYGTDAPQIGLIAEELPEAMLVLDGEYPAIDIARVAAVLWGALGDTIDQIDALTTRVTALEAIPSPGKGNKP